MIRLKSMVFMVVGLLLVAGLRADIYMLQKNHTDEYYNGGQMNPAVDRTQTIWVGENRVALISETRKVVMDGAAQRFLFLNLEDKTYVESKLPLEKTAIFPESLLQRMNRFLQEGVVTKTGENKNIDGRACTAYSIHSWVPYEGMKYNESEATRWLTLEVPFDLAAFKGLFDNLRKLNNYGDAYEKALAGMTGFMVRSESVRYREGTPIKSRTWVEKMEKGDPPADVYAVPPDFKKKETLSIQDLRGM